MSLTPRTDRLDKNYIINGSMDFWQRHNNTTVPAGLPGYYAADRWYMDAVNQGQAIVRSTDIPAGSKSKYSLEYNATIAAADREVAIQQRIESVFARDLIGEDISLRFNYKSESAIQLQVKISVADVEDDFSAVTDVIDETITITDDSTWYEYTKEAVTMPSTAGRGVSVEIRFKNMNVLASASHKIADVKLNIGSFAQDFSLAGRNWPEELSLCQRYYHKTYEMDDVPGTALAPGLGYHARNIGTGSATTDLEFPVRMRIPPTFTVYNRSTGAAGSWREEGPNADRALSSIQASTHLATATFVTATVGATLTGHYTVDAEL
jgi:hypothetical protein